MSILKVSITVRQVKAARALLDWSQEELAKYSKISIPTIKRLEAQDGALAGRPNTSIRIKDTLERAGIIFIEENGGGEGVRLRRAIQERFKKRARP